jgi:hypothetical protein
MLGKIKDIKRELFYTLVIFGITFAFNYFSYTKERNLLLAVGILGLLIIETWFIGAFTRYSERRISKYSEVLQRVSIRERFFSYFISPALLYISTLAFLYYTQTFTADLMVLITVSFLFLILFVNVKSSFKKVYTLEQATRIIFDFINIATFYLGCSVLTKLGLENEFFFILIGAWIWILLINNLLIHEKLEISSVVVSFLCTVFITLTTLAFESYGIYIMPAITTISFYLIISLWNLRFSGRIRMSDYISPFVFSAFATLIILYL